MVQIVKRLKHDQLTFGCTLRDLKDYIESKGGKVVAVTALLPSRYGTSLRPTNEQINELTKKGITNEQLKQLGIADGFTGLTKREAEQLLILAKPRGVRGTTQGRTTVKGGDEGNDAEVQTEVEAVNGTDSEAFKTDVSFIHSHLYFLCLITSKSESFSSCPYFHPSLNL